MRFSVIIPVYNAEKTLRRCVDSVLSQLGDRDAHANRSGRRAGHGFVPTSLHALYAAA